MKSNLRFLLEGRLLVGGGVLKKSKPGPGLVGSVEGEGKAVGSEWRLRSSAMLK